MSYNPSLYSEMLRKADEAISNLRIGLHERFSPDSEVTKVIKTAAARKGKDVTPLFVNPNDVLYTPENDASIKRVVIKPAVVRRDPSLSAQQNNLGIPLSVGTIVEELKTSNGFSFIKYNYGSSSRTGWVQTSCLGAQGQSVKYTGGGSGTVATSTNTVNSAPSSWSKSSLGSNYNDYKPVSVAELDNYSEEYISGKAQYDEPFELFVLPGYTPAKMTVVNYTDGRPVSHSFEFLIGPTAMSESNANSLVPIRTGAGFFILRNGAELGRLILGGFLMDSSVVDERRLFMENYYRNYMIDKYNAFHTYFNESSLFVDLEGFRYHCILQSLDLSRSSNSMFLYNYNMSLLVLQQESIGNIRRPGSRTTRKSEQNYAIENVINITSMLSSALTLSVLARR